MKFRLLMGKHTQEDVGTGDLLTYRAGDVFTSRTDLVAKFNSNGARKFERVEDDTPLQGSPARMQTPGTQRPVTPPTPQHLPAEPQPQVTVATQPREDGSLKGQTATLAVRPLPHVSELERMSVKDLIALCEEQEIDLHGAQKKEDVLKILRGAQR